MSANAPKLTPAPSSAEARATKIDRIRYLESWALENPLATIEAARRAVREKFGLSVGTQAISDTLRTAKSLWEQQRLATAAPRPVLTAPPVVRPVPPREQPIQQQIASWAASMRAAGIKLIEILDDGKVRVEFGA